MTRRLPPAHLFLARRLRELATRLSATIPRVRGRTDDEAIHDMRVALRRRRVVLRIARPVFGRYHCDSIRLALARVQRATGALRDEEVLRETLKALETGEAELDAWIARRARREEGLRAIIDHRLRAGDLRRPLRMLRALLALPVRPDRRRPVAAFAHKAVSRARKNVDRRRDASPDDAAALHALRIAYKRLRYTTEIFSEALPPDVAALAEPAAHFQKRLGEIHDLDVARDAMTKARALSPSAKARVLEAIERRRVERVQKYVAEAGHEHSRSADR